MSLRNESLREGCKAADEAIQKVKVEIIGVMVMFVKTITPLRSSNGTSSSSVVNTTPKVTYFTGSEAPKVHTTPKKFSFGAVGRVLAVLGFTGGAGAVLTACPSTPGPGGGEPPATVTTTSTNINTDTKISTATGTGIATSTATTPHTVTSKLNAAWTNAGIAMPTDGVPAKIEYEDTFYGGHVTETLDPTKTTNNAVVYNGINDTENGSYTKTYTYDEANNILTMKQKAGSNEFNYAITLDSNGYAVFTNQKTGKIDTKMRKIDTGKVGVYDASNKLLDTYANYKNDGYLAKWEKEAKSPIVRFTGEAKEKLARITEEGKKLASRFELSTKPAEFGKRLAKGTHV